MGRKDKKQETAESPASSSEGLHNIATLQPFRGLPFTKADFSDLLAEEGKRHEHRSKHKKKSKHKKVCLLCLGPCC